MNWTHPICESWIYKIESVEHFCETGKMEAENDFNLDRNFRFGPSVSVDSFSQQ